MTCRTPPSPGHGECCRKVDPILEGHLHDSHICNSHAAAIGNRHLTLRLLLQVELQSHMFRDAEPEPLHQPGPELKLVAFMLFWVAQLLVHIPFLPGQSESASCC
jgi:hypothetical protein